MIIFSIDINVNFRLGENVAGHDFLPQPSTVKAKLPSHFIFFSEALLSSLNNINNINLDKN